MNQCPFRREDTALSDDSPRLELGYMKSLFVTFNHFLLVIVSGLGSLYLEVHVWEARTGLMRMSCLWG